MSSRPAWAIQNKLSGLGREWRVRSSDSLLQSSSWEPETRGLQDGGQPGHKAILTFRRWRQEDQKSSVKTTHSLRPVWTT